MALASSCITGSPWHAEHTIDMRRGKSRNITSGLLLPNSTCAHPRQSVSLVFRSRFFFKLAFRFCFTACPNCRHFQRCFSLSKRVRSQCREPIYGFKVSKTSPKKPVFCFSRLQSCVTDAAFFHIGNRLTGLSFFLSFPSSTFSNGARNGNSRFHWRPPVNEDAITAITLESQEPHTQTKRPASFYGIA